MANTVNKPNVNDGDHRQWHPGLRLFWSIMAEAAEERLTEERAGKDRRGDKP